MRSLLRIFVVLLPWTLRRHVLRIVFGYRLHPESRIGTALVFPRQLVMERGARIGHLSVVKGLDLLRMGEQSSIGRLNWVTAWPSGTGSAHFAHLTQRRPELVLAEHAALTNRHIVDCTESVTIGRFATVAGFRSQILTHSIDVRSSRQDARPVTIGQYCFVGTACTILGGAVLPDFSILGAHALLNKAHEQRYCLYAGVPAVQVSTLDPGFKYFTRSEGYVL
jgi:serine acetyltransferase